MAFEIPSSRIRQLQAGLRREAGLLSYEPAAPSPPQLPTIRDAVAALDPGLSSSLRCDRCGGGLLRGLQSTICIYCGQDRRKEGISHSISFNSTVGCRKLLDFLGLDGSEVVLLDTDTSSSKKGQDTLKSELVLSDLLDLVLKWPLDKEDVDENNTTASPSLNTNVLRLTGVDLDDIFPERKGGASFIVPDPNDEFMPRQNSQENIYVSSETNFTALGKPQNTETKTSFFSGNIEGSFGAWNAEFQATSASTSAVSPKSLDLFQDSSVSSLGHAAITEDTKDQLEKIEAFVGFENKSGQLISVNKVFQDDFCPTESDKIESSKNSVKDETHIDKGNSVTKGVSEFSVQDGLQLSSSNSKSEISTQNNLTDDSFDDWQDFTSSARRTSSLKQGTGINLFGDSSATKPDYLFPKSSENELQSLKTLVGKNDSVDEWQDFASFGPQESSIVYRTQSDMTLPAHSSGKKSVTPPHTSSNSRSDTLITMDVSHDDCSDVWCFASSVEDPINQEAQTKILPLKDSLEIDAFNSCPTSNTKDLDKRKPLHGDDDWQDLASFAEGLAKSLNVESQSNSTFLDLTSETKSTDTWHSKEKESTNKLDDAFDDWQDFTSSVEVRSGLSGDGEQSMIPVFLHPSETNSVHQQGMKTDGLFDALEIQKHQSDENNSKLDVMTCDGTNEVDKKTALDPHPLWNANENIGSSDANSNSEPPKSNVEKLESQMHDLSFMLVDELSVPENCP
ncbi:uncharacterized protein LOC141820785 [Curcuma longa]|uniref:uncharacterized protein LOC141820785 n=1 Tax=Curcuma longa TaxID=136217 RepID=UPI003D9DEB54